jgi:hypothetical protein
MGLASREAEELRSLEEAGVNKVYVRKISLATLLASGDINLSIQWVYAHQAKAKSV